MKNKKIKIIFGIVLTFLFLLIEYKYRVETTKYELSENEKYYLIRYDYSGKSENSDIKEEQTFTSQHDGLNYVYINFYRKTKMYYDLSQIISNLSEVAFTPNTIEYIHTKCNRFRQIVQLVNQMENFAKDNNLAEITKEIVEQIV